MDAASTARNNGTYLNHDLTIGPIWIPIQDRRPGE
jgi:hypothetical protein